MQRRRQGGSEKPVKKAPQESRQAMGMARNKQLAGRGGRLAISLGGMIFYAIRITMLAMQSNYGA